MRVNDLLIPSQSEAISILQARCSTFLQESNSQPVIRNLPTSYSDFHKVKVRKRKAGCKFTDVFNEAFMQEHYNLRQRSIFANGVQSFQYSSDPTQEAFYVFPVDGYKYLYSKAVERSDVAYKTVFDAINEEVGNTKASEVLAELLRFTYTSTNLAEGIAEGAEIIFYGIPYYYAVRKSAYSSYESLLTYIRDK